MDSWLSWLAPREIYNNRAGGIIIQEENTYSVGAAGLHAQDPRSVWVSRLFDDTT